MTDDVERPARLNVLLGAMHVTVMSATSSEIVASGVWVKPGRMRSQWISSERISILFSRHISARIFSSPRCPYPTDRVMRI